MVEHTSSDAVLLCGGAGTRLRPLTQDLVPKSLYSVGGRPLIHHTLEHLPPPLVHTLVLAIGHHGDQIKGWFATNPTPHDLKYSYQNTPGVLDAIACGLQRVQCDEANVVCNTDEIRSGLKLEDVLAFHKSVGTPVTLVGTHSDHLSRHGVMTVDDAGRITQFNLKPNVNPDRVGIVFTGLMIIDRRAQEHFDPKHNRDWMGLIDPIVDASLASAFVLPNLHYFNVGTEEEFDEAEQYYLQQHLTSAG